MEHDNTATPAAKACLLSVQGSSLRAWAARNPSLCRRVCQWMKKTTSQNAVVTMAARKCSQANGSERTAAQCRHASAAGMADGDVASAEVAKVRRSVFSGMTGVLCGIAWGAGLLVQGPASAVLAIALNVLAIGALIVAHARN